MSDVHFADRTVLCGCGRHGLCDGLVRHSVVEGTTPCTCECHEVTEPCS